MSKLPPYSTYRTDKSQMLVPQAVSANNVLTYTPRGFNQELNIKFPDSRLAVCKRCKKNYKTKDVCRVKNGHTSEPWTTAYICVTLDESCTDQNGNFIKDQQLTVRMSNWQPLFLKKDFSLDTPVCASCKRTNRTRSFCREKHRHRHLPWCTVYVILSAVESTDPSTVMAAPSQPNIENENEEFLKSIVGDSDLLNDPVNSDTDDIFKIEASRTFLSQVSCTKNTVHWLQYAEGEKSAPVHNESDVKALNDAIRTASVQPDTNAALPTTQFHQQPHLHHQQQLAAWNAQYGHQMIPAPILPFPTMLPPPPPQIAGIQQDGNEQGINNSSQGTVQPIVPSSTPEAYAQWHAQMMFHQQLYQQQFYAHPQFIQQSPLPQYISHVLQGNESEHNQATPHVEITTTVMNPNAGTETAQSDLRSAKRQRLEEPNDPNAIESTSIEPTLYKTDQFELAPIEGSIEIQPLENAMISTSPALSNE